MSKPHEMVLETRFNGGNTCLTDQTGRIVAYVRDAEDERFFKAAPEMARTLMRASACDVPGLCRECRTAMTDALKKAGIP